jgi:hypothetical protein
VLLMQRGKLLIRVAGAASRPEAVGIARSLAAD